MGNLWLLEHLERIYVMKQFQLPCLDLKDLTSSYPGQRALLKKCLWKGLPVDCAAVFDVFPTDRGMCCTFNMKKVPKLTQKSMSNTICLQFFSG